MHLNNERSACLSTSHGHSPQWPLYSLGICLGGVYNMGQESNVGVMS